MDYLPTLGEKWPHSEGNVGKYSIHGSYGYFLRHFGLDGSYTQQTIAALETLETQVVTCFPFWGPSEEQQKKLPIATKQLIYCHCTSSLQTAAQKYDVLYTDYLYIYKHVSIKQTLSFQSRCSCISMYFGNFFFHIIITLRSQVTFSASQQLQMVHPLKTNMVIAVKSSFLIGDTSSKRLFWSMVMLIFQGVVPLLKFRLFEEPKMKRMKTQMTRMTLVSCCYFWGALGPVFPTPFPRQIGNRQTQTTPGIERLVLKGSKTWLPRYTMQSSLHCQKIHVTKHQYNIQCTCW